MKLEDFNYGDLVRDKVTGYEGIVMAKSSYSNGCDRLGLQAAKVTEKGNVPDYQWIDIQQVVIAKKGVVRFENEKPVGGPMPIPKR